MEALHGKLDPLATVDMDVCTKLDLEFHIPFQGRKERLEINTLQTVRELMKTISKIVGLPASKLKVYRKVIFEGDLLDTQLMSMYPKKNLWSYNMTHEDVIVCDHKDNQSVVKDIRVKFC